MPAIDGLSSGLDTTSIISQLMALERAPQQRLQVKQTAAESSITSLRTLNTKFLSIFSAAEKLGARLPDYVVPTPPPPSDWEPTKATSSDSARATATATAGAPAGTMTFNVKQLATTASHLSAASYGSTTAAFSTAADGTTHTALKLTKQDGTVFDVNTVGGSLAETVTAINAADAGVRASTVQVSPGVYRMQLTATTTGAAGGFTLVDPDNNSELNAGGVVGQDAQLVMSGVSITSPTNTFTNVLEGVTLTVTKADTAAGTGFVEPAVTVNVKKDNDGIAAKVQALVDAANAARTEAKSLTAFDPTTKAKGRLYGDSGVRSLVDMVSSSFSAGGAGPALAGITTARDGTISFDKAKFLTALEADPAKVELALGKDGLAGRLHKMADQVSRGEAAVGGPGLIITAIKGRESQIASIKDGIASWDTRLAMKQKQLERTYTGLETALSKAKSQGQWLSGQLANLPTWN